ncbi:MAG: hypothetical protein HZA17_08320 [Nitrospirae bacterium]|nr:hypothetical protein [Nitrospirota bacterium]
MASVEPVEKVLFIQTRSLTRNRIMDMSNLDTIKKESEKDAAIQRTVGGSLYWIQAVIFQGKRTLDAEKIEFHEYTITRMEEQFFLNTSVKAIEWVSDTKEQGCLVDEIEDFLSIPSIGMEAKKVIDNPAECRKGELKKTVIKLVRNKREHDVEIFGSQKKEEIVFNTSSPGSKLKLILGHSITQFRGGRILLGGVIDVQEVIDAAVKLEVHLRNKQHELWKKRSKDVDFFLAPKGLIAK